VLYFNKKGGHVYENAKGFGGSADGGDARWDRGNACKCCGAHERLETMQLVDNNAATAREFFDSNLYSKR